MEQSSYIGITFPSINQFPITFDQTPSIPLPSPLNFETIMDSATHYIKKYSIAVIQQQTFFHFVEINQQYAHTFTTPKVTHSY